MSTTTVSFHENNQTYEQYRPLLVSAKGTRKAKSCVARYASSAFQRGKTEAPELRSPYLSRDLKRFEDTFRSDGVVKQAVLKKWNFIQGAKTRVALDVDADFENDDERSALLQQIQAYPPYQKAKKIANKVLRNINFREKIHAAGVSASVYGRSAIEKVRDNDGMIVDLHVLNSRLLGDVKAEPNSWRLLGVQYQDLPSGHDILPARDLIYITRNDVHVSPGSLYYGLSDLETVVDGSETKRILLQEDLKEIVKALWAGFGWIKFKNANVTKQQIEEVVNNFLAGAWTGTDHNIEIDVKQIAQNSPMLVEILNEVNREIARDLGVPAPLLGYEHLQNFASIQQTLIAWKESDLDAERRWLQNIVQRQVLDDILFHVLKQEGIAYNPGESILVQEKKFPKPTTSPLGMGIAQPVIPPQPIITTREIPPAKLVYEIEDPSLSSRKENAEIAIMYYEKNLISPKKALEEVDMSDQVTETEMRLKQDENRRIQQEDARFDMELQGMKIQQENTMMRSAANMRLKDLISNIENETGTNTQNNNKIKKQPIY